MTGLAIRVIVEGRVQAVWFRGWTVQEATARGLAGWVRNLGNGSVEALFAGDEAAVRGMVDACRQGPPAARVVAVHEYPATAPEHTGFLTVR
ncbi:MAG: acylphosphatase [Alphaproteobacteria bacterium]|jgi:acylphosphatase|nr:acylphosphatase [Alphaproteobacteria bacterium]